MREKVIIETNRPMGENERELQKRLEHSRTLYLVTKHMGKNQPNLNNTHNKKIMNNYT